MNRRIRSCIDCDYRLDGLRTPRCPECGRAFDPADSRTYRIEIVATRRLVIARSMLEAHLIIDRLRDESIVVSLVGGVTDWGGTSPEVWVCERDVARAVPIVHDIQRRPQPDDACPECGYDLRGQRGKRGTAKCPECGVPAHTAPVERPCTHCGEMVPEHFDVGWSCGPALGRSHPAVS